MTAAGAEATAERFNVAQSGLGRGERGGSARERGRALRGRRRKCGQQEGGEEAERHSPGLRSGSVHMRRPRRGRERARPHLLRPTLRQPVCERARAAQTRAGWARAGTAALDALHNEETGDGPQAQNSAPGAGNKKKLTLAPGPAFLRLGPPCTCTVYTDHYT